MKTPEEWKREWYNRINSTDWERGLDLKIISEIQKEAWNAALDFAVSKVCPMMLSDMDEIHAERIKQSILEGKI